MSSHIKDQKQQQQQKAEPKRDLDADHLFNQHMIKTLAYTGIGFGFGMLSSLFFKHRKALSLIGAGSGAAYGASNLLDDLNHFKRFQSYGNQQQPQTLKREGQIASQDWQQYMPKEQSQFQQKNYQRGGSDDDSDNKKDSKSKGDERDSSYSKKIADEAARQLSKKSSEQKDTSSQKSSPKDDRSQKSSESKKQEISKKESPSKSQDQPKPQQQSSRKDQSKDQDHTKPQQKQELKKDQSKDQGHSGTQPKPELKKDQSKDQDHTKPQQKQNQSDKQQGQDNKKQLSKSSNSKETEKSSQQFGGNKQEITKKASLSKEEPKEIGEKSYQVGPSTFLKVEGQQFMDFTSNSANAGKPASGKRELYKGNERPTKDSDNLVKLTKQDEWGKSTKTGNKMKVEDPDHSKAGSQFSGDNLTAKSQVNTVIE